MDQRDSVPYPVVVGQRVRNVKVARAKQLRREMTTAERILWQLLRANRCNELHFRRQQVIAGFIADFYCHAARVIVELDGSIHQRTGKYDSARDTALAARGLRILRFTNDDVMYHREQVIEHITAECEARIATRLPEVTPVSAPGATPSVTGSPSPHRGGGQGVR